MLSNGRGLNTSGSINIPGGTLAPNISVVRRFVLCIQSGGSFRFFVNVETLPYTQKIRPARRLAGRSLTKELTPRLRRGEIF